MSRKFVLDASAIIAVINCEKGYEKVEKVLGGSQVSTVNVAEVLSKLTERGILADEATEQFLQLGVAVVDFDIQHSMKTAELRPLTRHLGLSLGDRACLALSVHEKATAVTSDRSWASLDVCRVEIIR